MISSGILTQNLYKMTNIEKIEFIDEFLSELEDVLHVIEGRDCTKSRKYLEELKQAINYSQCCEKLNGKKKITFDLWCKIKNIQHSFDDYYLWEKTLIEKEHILRMYKSFTESI